MLHYGVWILVCIQGKRRVFGAGVIVEHLYLNCINRVCHRTYRPRSLGSSHVDLKVQKQSYNIRFTATNQNLEFLSTRFTPMKTTF